MPHAYPPSAAKLADAEKKSGAAIIAGEAITQAAAPTEPPLTQEPAAAAPQLPKAPVARAVFYPPITEETRTHIPTPQAAYYLNRAQQTLRAWCVEQKFPPGLKPIHINKRLAWPVAGIRALLGVA